MTAKNESLLKSDISNAIANNNSGDITAEDVRESMKDIVDSIPLIISEANMNATYPFQKNVKAERLDDTGQNGIFIAGSGVQFGDNPAIQIVPFPGVENLDHGQLEPNSLLDDDHLHYLNVNGVRPMEGNLGLDNNWLNSVGNPNPGVTNSNDRGVQFSHDATSDVETVHVGSKTIVEFDDDASRIDTSKGVAKAWINFDASSGSSITVNASYNIKKIEKTSIGKFIITFRDEIPVPYVAIGLSNARTDSDEAEDFSINSIGIVERASTYLSFLVLSTLNNTYVDAAVNDLVVFGLSHADEVAEETTPPPQLP